MFSARKISGFVVLLLFLTACAVALTFPIEGQECFLKFGISVRPLAHILDTNKEGKEELRLEGEQEKGGGGGIVTVGWISGEVDGEMARFHNWNTWKKGGKSGLQTLL